MCHTGIPRVQGHGLKALMRPKRGAGPLPHSSHLGLTSQAVTVRSHGRWMPMAETDIGIGEVNEQIVVFGRAAIDTMLAV